MLSKKVRRNVSGTLAVVGIVCVVARLWNVIMEPQSSRSWFELFGMIILTYLCFDSWRIFRRRLAAEKSKSERYGK